MDETEYYQCSICPIEQHEGRFCRCEVRNIWLGKELRTRGESPWMKNDMDKLQKDSENLIKDGFEFKQ